MKPDEIKFTIITSPKMYDRTTIKKEVSPYVNPEEIILVGPGWRPRQKHNYLQLSDLFKELRIYRNLIKARNKNGN